MKRRASGKRDPAPPLRGSWQPEGLSEGGGKGFRLKTFVILFLVILLCACAGQEREPEGWLLYFTAPGDASFGSALSTQSWQGEGEPEVETLLEALFDGPTEEGLNNPFPRGVTVQALELDGETGILHLTLSEQYSGLTDISRTLADACIVMTACQFPGVEAVEISSAGFWSGTPARRTLSPEQLETQELLP